MKVLVLGASGMMGHMACRVLGETHEVFGACRSWYRPDHPLATFLPKEHWLGGMDVHHWDSVVRIMGITRPDVVLNCVGVVKQLDEAKNPLTAIEINALLPHKLALLCSVAGAKLIHLSTDCVFSGNKGMYTEEDNPDPVDLYGRSKLLGETSAHRSLTIRTSIVGRQIIGHTGLFEWVLSQRGRKVKGFEKAIYSGLTTMALSRIIVEIIEKHAELEGVWQVASEPINKYELLCEMNRRMNLNMAIEKDETFCCDRSLNGIRFAVMTNITVPSWDAMLANFVNDESTYNVLNSR